MNYSTLKCIQTMDTSIEGETSSYIPYTILWSVQFHTDGIKRKCAFSTNQKLTVCERKYTNFFVFLRLSSCFFQKYLFSLYPCPIFFLKLNRKKNSISVTFQNKTLFIYKSIWNFFSSKLYYKRIKETTYNWTFHCT